MSFAIAALALLGALLAGAALDGSPGQVRGLRACSELP